jgi:hypothetical protein
MASELRVPTVAMAAEVTCVDGRVFRGRVFVPASSSLHGGPMRAEEWMNGAGLFFPFLPDEAEAPVILNKAEVLTVTVGSEPERALEEAVDIDRGVQVECGGQVLRGHLHIDMPPHHSRVLDYLNRADAFLVLHDGDRLHLVQKQNITRVTEVREG